MGAWVSLSDVDVDVAVRTAVQVMATGALQIEGQMSSSSTVREGALRHTWLNTLHCQVNRPIYTTCSALHTQVRCCLLTAAEIS